MSLFPRPILPVLMYHRFGTPEAGDTDLWISEDQFRAQLRWLADRGYRTLSLDEAYQAWSRRQTPRRAVLITIDDGFADDLARAADLLQDTGARATVFVPAGLLGQEVDLGHPDGDASRTSSGRLARSQELSEWCDRGHDVGCHSMTHRDLTRCDPVAFHDEIHLARRQLSEELGRPIEDFCYPFAHHDDAVRNAVRAAGFRAAYAGEPPMDDVLAIPRMMVYPRDDPARFRRKVSGYYFWISALHQKLRRFVGN